MSRVALQRRWLPVSWLSAAAGQRQFPTAPKPTRQWSMGLLTPILWGATFPGAKIALDLQQVRYVDGPGCGAVLALHRAMAALGGEVKIFSLHQPVRALFQKLHLHRRVPTYNVGDDALRSFQART